MKVAAHIALSAAAGAITVYALMVPATRRRTVVVRPVVQRVLEVHYNRINSAFRTLPSVSATERFPVDGPLSGFEKREIAEGVAMNERGSR